MIYAGYYFPPSSPQQALGIFDFTPSEYHIFIIPRAAWKSLLFSDYMVVYREWT